jgi:hypothetical protein
MIRNVRTIWVREECGEILDSFIPRLFICRSVTGRTILLKMSVPVDARYFPRGGVCDAELEAMEAFKNVSSFMKISLTASFSADKIRRCLHQSLVTVSKATETTRNLHSFSVRQFSILQSVNPPRE